MATFMATVFTIAELSKEFGVTHRAIRFYEDQGLLSPEREGQSRRYQSRDRVRLKLIARGKRLGFSLREIAEMIDLYDAPEGEVGQLEHFIQKMRERRSELLRQRTDIDHVLTELDQLEERCKTILNDNAIEA